MLVGSVVVVSAQSTDITFSTPVTIAGDGDVATNGALVSAYDLYGTSGNVTVNGVSFLGSHSQTELGINFLLSGIYGAGANYAGFTSSSAPWSGLSSGYQAVLSGGDYTSFATAVTVTLTNLAVGHQYLVQYWVSDPRNTPASQTETVVGANTVTLQYNSIGSSGGVGQYTIGTFTASATVESFTIQASGSAPSTYLNAIQLRDLGAPGGIAFSTPVTISGDSDVATNGIPVSAYDLGAGAGNATVNGVSFVGSTSSTALGANFLLSGFPSSAYYYGFTSSSAPWSDLSSSYQAVLSGGDNTASPSAVTVTLTNLAVGHRYLVQYWVSDPRNTPASQTETVVGENIVTLQYNSTGSSGGVGQYTIGTFTASATATAFTIQGSGSAPSTYLNAIQLRDLGIPGGIAFSAPVTISGDSDVATDGILISAYDFYGSPGNVTVNGVSFVGTYSETALGVTFLLSGIDANYTGFTSSSAPWSGLSSDYQAVLSGGDYTSYATAVTVTLTNLAMGHQYLVQYWASDPRNTAASQMETVEGENFVTLQYNSTGSSGGVGQYTIGTFTASATTESFTIQASGSAPSTYLNAIQLRDLGAPGGIAFSAPVTISGDSDVATNGIPVSAYDLGAGAGNVTVNGVSFVGSTSSTALGANFLLSGFPSSAYYYGFTSSSAPWSDLSGSYQAVLSGGDNTPSPSVVTVTVTNLTVGDQYLVQYWVSDPRNTPASQTETVVGENVVTLQYNSLGSDGGVGQYTIGTFTATATATAFTIQGSGSAPSTYLNAIQLRDLGSSSVGTPTLSSGVALGGGQFQLTFSGPNSQTYSVLTSTNLALPMTNWTVLTSGTFGGSPVNYTDTGATNGMQFYIITSP